MPKFGFILLYCLLPVFTGALNAQDSLMFKGQISTWALYNGGLELPVYTGARYIPQMNYEINLKGTHLIDFEASANLNGNFGFHPFDTINPEGQLKPYRVWARYSSSQFEVRAGLQKINFGSASMLRPLMWFDQVDPRDPLKLTDGVWGILGRYYFLNNANIWLWGLYGNEDPKGWEIAGTHKSIPEFGGRIQSPIPAGEAGLSYHHRTADTRKLEGIIPPYEKVQENRIGLDVKLDLILGIWLEGSWVKNNKYLGTFTNQEVFNAGLDYTFGMGNGLLLTYEQLLMVNDEKAFQFDNSTPFSLLSLSYPIGFFDNITGIVYYDWTNNTIYNFFNWQHQFKLVTFYLMAYWNPEDYRIPTQASTKNLFAGRGIQLMFVLNH
ncbi:MAG: hypothetical protein K9G38_06900 [Bacteroidales bacterium]|nr:hypothetical protein [Bacteroidales bacterium]